jgi:hypothetical protein
MSVALMFHQTWPMSANIILHEEQLAQKIYLIRETKVMFDFHLAALYEVTTSALKQQVRRNINRFPEDFMFTLTKQEWQELITNCDKLAPYKFSPSLPFVFTEQGIAMLSSVLRSENAVNVNIAIMRTFVHVRKMVETSAGLARQLQELEEKYDAQFKTVFQAIRKVIQPENPPRKPIGFR